MVPHRAYPRAFTLVELMIVIAIVAVLAALAILGVRRYLLSAKTAEAKEAVGAITRKAVIQHEVEHSQSQVIEMGGPSSGTSHMLCQSATPVPGTFNLVQGTKYQPITTPGADFMSGTPIQGWQCLGFAITTPIYFQYHYTVGSGYLSQGIAGAPVPTGPEAFEAAARGDLDGDNSESLFMRSGEVHNGQVVLSTQVFSNNELE